MSKRFDLGPVTASAQALAKGFVISEEDFFERLKNLKDFYSQTVEASNTAVSAKNTAVSSMETAVSAKDTAVSAKNTAVSSMETAVSAKDTAVSAKNDAASSAETAAASEAHAVEVAESIPSDYTALSNAFYALGLSVDDDGYICQTVEGDD